MLGGYGVRVLLRAGGLACLDLGREQFLESIQPGREGGEIADGIGLRDVRACGADGNVTSAAKFS